jgi:hypothetical protein
MDKYSKRMWRAYSALSVGVGEKKEKDNAEARRALRPAKKRGKTRTLKVEGCGARRVRITPLFPGRISLRAAAAVYISLARKPGDGLGLARLGEIG